MSMRAFRLASAIRYPRQSSRRSSAWALGREIVMKRVRSVLCLFILACAALSGASLAACGDMNSGGAASNSSSGHSGGGSGGGY
jgi:hypothetical protein